MLNLLMKRGQTQPALILLMEAETGESDPNKMTSAQLKAILPMLESKLAASLKMGDRVKTQYRVSQIEGEITGVRPHTGDVVVTWVEGATRKSKEFPREFLMPIL